MPDISRHLDRAKQALDRGNTEMVFETLGECFEFEPANQRLHRIWLDAAKLRAKTAGKGGLFGLGGGLGGLSLSRDPVKTFAAQAKRLKSAYDTKILFDCGEAAHKAAAAGIKGMTEVAVAYYEEVRATGLFHDKALWNLGHCYMDLVKASGNRDEAALENALRCLRELLKAMPTHPDASRELNNWEAIKSMVKRNSATAGDYRGQLSNESASKRAEVMNRIIRTAEDAKEVLAALDEELKTKPTDKSLWMKRGKVLARYGTADQAREAFRKVLAIDSHDFLATVDLADLDLADLKRAIETATATGGDAAAAKQAFATAEIAEFRRRIERQPTELMHRFHLGQRLINAGQIEAAAAEFQRTVQDAKLKKPSLRALGWCFAQKNLLDLARQQFDAYLATVEDDSADEAKQVRYERARAFEGLKRRDEAIADYNRLVAIDLGFRDAAQRLAHLQQGG